jgi:hypothetical protein
MSNHEGIVLRHRKCLTRHPEVAMLNSDVEIIGN